MFPFLLNVEINVFHFNRREVSNHLMEFLESFYYGLKTIHSFDLENINKIVFYDHLFVAKVTPDFPNIPG